MKKINAGTILRIVSVVCVLIFAVAVLSYGFSTKFGIPDLFKKPADSARETPYVYEEEVKTLREIEVDWVSGPVTLKYYDGELIRITETAKKEISEDEKLYLEVSGGTVSVRWNSKLLQLGVSREEAKQLELLIPERFSETLEAVSITTVSGDIGIDGLMAEEASFGSTSGEMHLSNITAERFETETVSGGIFCRNVTGSEHFSASSTSGDMELSAVSGGEVELDTTSGETVLDGTAAQLSCTSVSGDVKLDLHAWPVETEIASVSGGVEIFAPDAEDGFLCSFSSVSGDFNCGFEAQKSGDRYLRGAGKNVLTVDTTSGDFSLHEKVG
ncbi:MAG: DUF4097 family beta strand repeat protein [Clostridia bacterium]|nr:DUF4097 family beta strand repeat protein [Clostridia bacterium]